MPTKTRPSRRPYHRERITASRRLGLGVLAGLVGGVAVDLAGRAAEQAGHPRRPTLPAQLVAKTVRLPPAGRRRQGPTRHTAAMITGMQDATGTDPQRIEDVGQVAHYAWSAAWGAGRGLIATPRFSRFSASLIHAVAFAAADDVLLAATNLGTPIWGRHDDATAAAAQTAQLLLYSLATSLAYQQLAAARTSAPSPRPARTAQRSAP